VVASFNNHADLQRLKSRIGGPRPPLWQGRAARHAVAPNTTGCVLLRQILIETGNRDIHMPVRLKKLIGTILLVALVVIYALVATIVAVAQLSESGPVVHLLFFLVSGLLWILPAMAIIKWMIVEPKQKG
jgi:hypothetical protein